jgi:putative ABC transport system permease protein
MVMRALDRKLVRDLARLKMQAIAIGLVIAAGTAVFVGTAATARALRLSEERYYAEHRFAHVWTHLVRAPDAVLRDLSSIPGVAAVDGRLITQGVIDVPGFAEPATGLFISIPPTHGHVLNDVYIRRGRHVEANGADEALISEAFADRNGLKPGDTIGAVIAGHPVRVRIVGVALSPEFIMQIQPGGLIPDDRRFSVFWMSRDRLEALLDLRGAFNDVALRLSAGANEPAVIRAVDRVLDPYGGQGAYGRSTQPSHVMLEAHIRPVAALAVVVPAIFLAVAMFLINVVLSRLVATDRMQIGMLKAFGYTNGRLARHYLLLALAIAAGGYLVGVPIGLGLGRLMSVWFSTFFRFPVLVFSVEPVFLLIAAVAMLGSSALGAFVTVTAVARMAPMVAMMPPAPMYRPTWFDRSIVAKRLLRAPVIRMILRSLTRRPVRAVLTAGGMSLAIAIVVFGGFTADALKRVVDVRFQHEERQDLSVVLRDARSLDRQWEGLPRLPGIRVAEPYRAAPARLHVGTQMQDVIVVGLQSDSRLRRVMDLHYGSMSIPQDGVVIGAWLGAQLGIHRGDPITLEIRQGRRRMVTSRVVGLVDEPLGRYVYGDLQTIGRLLEEPNTFTAVNVLVDPARANELYAELKRSPTVLGVEFRRASLLNFRAMGDETVAFIRRIEIVFAIIIAFGVVYNTARIAVAERSHELATLRVLGFTRREISSILLGEIGTLAAPAVPLGCVFGYLLSSWLAGALSSELFRFPVVLDVRTYTFAIAVFAVAALGSALVVRRHLDRLDLVAVLKARE